VTEVSIKKIEKVLETLRPYLHSDGGDVILLETTDEGIVKVKLTGACVDCPMSQMTLRAGIERVLMQKIPSIRRVEAIN